MTVGQRMKAARIAAKLSRKETAKKLKRSIHTIKSWELDRHRPSPLLISRIEALFSLQNGALTSEIDMQNTQAIKRLGCAISKLPEQKKTHAIKIVEYFSLLIS